MKLLEYINAGSRNVIEILTPENAPSVLVASALGVAINQHTLADEASLAICEYLSMLFGCEDKLDRAIMTSDYHELYGIVVTQEMIDSIRLDTLVSISLKRAEFKYSPEEITGMLSESRESQAKRRDMALLCWVAQGNAAKVPDLWDMEKAQAVVKSILDAFDDTFNLIDIPRIYHGLSYIIVEPELVACYKKVFYRLSTALGTYIRHPDLMFAYLDNPSKETHAALLEVLTQDINLYELTGVLVMSLPVDISIFKATTLKSFVSIINATERY